MPGLAGAGSVDPAAGAGAAGAGDIGSCVTQTEEAKRIPVDMYIMLDRSESMLGVTGTGETKWDSIRQALTMFVSDPRSEGLSVGLQYFPLGRPGVPPTCVQDSECGAAGPCMTRMCQPPASVATFVPVYCADDSECPNDTLGCARFGVCEDDTDVVCFEDIGSGLAGCLALGDCLPVRSQCKNFATCDPADYAAPAVEIAELPARANAITTSLQMATPIGLTPTSAALAGALQQARDRAMREPTHRVVAVLATDGLPTECEPIEPDGVAEIARSAASQTPAIHTYVIGVFSPEETPALMNLESWAQAGGTEKAYVLDPSQDVNAQFLDALEEIRGGTLACEYELPPSPQGSTLDLGLVNVAVVSDRETRELRYVGDASGCDRTELGWHYDADPNGGQATKIVACARACEVLKNTSGRVELRLGCKTQGPD